MAFRISIGNPIAREYKGTDTFFVGVCKTIEERLANLKNLSFEQLISFNETENEIILVSGKEVVLSIFLEKERNPNNLWVVIQAYYPTWKYPNHLSFSGPAKVFVDGFSIDISGKLSKLESTQLYEFS
jgi:hypothetical protein